uniref:Uncharacterized protein n=1 Tax=Rhizophora mucronata TaxID=61149 RepID=A0A2P2QQ01_RHIMU
MRMQNLLFLLTVLLICWMRMNLGNWVQLFRSWLMKMQPLRRLWPRCH